MKQITPTPDDIGQRLDRYLRKIFPWARLGEIYEALRTKKVTIWGKKLPENTRLREGDVLDIDLSEEIIKNWQENENENAKCKMHRAELTATRYAYGHISNAKWDNWNTVIQGLLFTDPTLWILNSEFWIIQTNHLDQIPDMKPTAKAALTAFGEIIDDMLRTSLELPARLLIDRVLELIKYTDYLEDNFSPPEVEAKTDTISELKNLASRYDDLPPAESLMHFLEDIALITDSQENTAESKKVVLMTTHSAKWLEFEHVIIAGAEEWIFPHSRTLFEPDQLEEERRLFYVAMTRAKQKLIITRANERYSFGTYASNIVSRFVGEIPSEYSEEHAPKKYAFISDYLSTSGESTLQGDWWQRESQPKKLGLWAQVRQSQEFALWDRVEHSKFGIGTIVSLAGDVSQIVFSSGVKSLNIRIAPLTKK